MPTVETIARVSLKCTQCDRPFSLFDRESIENPPAKPICPTCQRLINLGLEEEK
jgi:hypothetical protein